MGTTTRVRKTDEGTQTWRVTHRQEIDVADDENEQIDFATDLETLPHTIRMTVNEWADAYAHKSGFAIEHAEYENNQLISLEISYYDTYFDRSTDKSYPTWESVIWELEAFG